MTTSKTKVLRFSKTIWKQPIVCKLASDYGLTFNIIKASILPRQEGPGAATVIEAMGAGRKAARSMKAYLGIRDPDQPYAIDGRGSTARMFGLDPQQRNFARIRAA